MSFTSRLDRANRAFAPSRVRSRPRPRPRSQLSSSVFKAILSPPDPPIVSSQGVSLPGLAALPWDDVPIFSTGRSVRAPVLSHPKFDVLPQKKARFFLKKLATYRQTTPWALQAMRLSQGRRDARAQGVLRSHRDVPRERVPRRRRLHLARLTNVHGRVEFTFTSRSSTTTTSWARSNPRPCRRYLKIGEAKELTDKVTNVTPLAQEEAAKAAELKAVASGSRRRLRTTADLPAPLATARFTTRPRPRRPTPAIVIVILASSTASAADASIGSSWSACSTANVAGHGTLADLRPAQGAVTVGTVRPLPATAP